MTQPYQPRTLHYIRSPYGELARFICNADVSKKSCSHKVNESKSAPAEAETTGTDEGGRHRSLNTLPVSQLLSRYRWYGWNSHIQARDAAPVLVS